MKTQDPDPPFPVGNPDERELLLSWLGFLRGAVLRKINALNDDDSRWTPNGRLISLLGIVNHLTKLEWRWIDGSMRGEDTKREPSEFYPGPELTVDRGGRSVSGTSGRHRRLRQVDASQHAMPGGRSRPICAGWCSTSSTKPRGTRATRTQLANCWTAPSANSARRGFASRRR